MAEIMSRTGAIGAGVAAVAIAAAIGAGTAAVAVVLSGRLSMPST